MNSVRKVSRGLKALWVFPAILMLLCVSVLGAEKGLPKAEPAVDDKEVEGKPDGGDEKKKPDAKPAESDEKTKKPKAKPEPKVEVSKPLLFGFEAVKPWSIPGWCDGGFLAAENKVKTEGEGAVRLVVKNPKEGKIAIARPTKKISLRDFGSVMLDAFVEKERSYPAAVTLALQFKGEPSWVESRPHLLEQGWNRKITFDLYKPEWKTKSTDWTYRTTPQKKGEPTGICLLFHGLDYEESLVIDNLNFALADENASVPEDAELREAAVKQPDIPTHKQETPDLTRADKIRAYICETLSAYAANLDRAGRKDDAQAISKTVADALGATLVARAMPVIEKPKPKPKKPKDDASAEKPEADGKEPDGEKETLTIMVPKRGNYLVAGRSTRSFFLGRHLTRIAAKSTDLQIIIKTEPEATEAKIEAAMEACKKAGFADVKVVKGDE